MIRDYFLELVKSAIEKHCKENNFSHDLKELNLTDEVPKIPSLVILR